MVQRDSIANQSKPAIPEVPASMELMNIDQLAALLKVKKSWIYKKTSETGPESIPRLKVGMYLRFEPGAVVEWLRDQTAEKVGVRRDGDDAGESHGAPKTTERNIKIGGWI